METKEFFNSFLQSSSRGNKIGVEYELFIVQRDENLSPIPYESDTTLSIKSVISFFLEQGWVPIKDRFSGEVVGISKDLDHVTFEPGCQIEYSSPPCATITGVYQRVLKFYLMLSEFLKGTDFFLLPIGYHPYLTAAPPKNSIFPKKRYKLMHQYMFHRGPMSHDMMYRTASTQICMNFHGEHDLMTKISIIHGLSCVANTLFSFSSLRMGNSVQFSSYRAHVWENVDYGRCGYIKPIYNQQEFSLYRYVKYIMNLPIYFLPDDKGYDSFWQGESFCTYLEASAGDREEKKIISDWDVHHSSFFPIIRVKKGFVEIRIHDSLPLQYLSCQITFWYLALYVSEISLCIKEILHKQKNNDNYIFFIASCYKNTALHDVIRNLIISILTIMKQWCKDNRCDLMYEDVCLMQKLLHDPLWKRIEKFYNGSSSSLYEFFMLEEQAILI